MSNSDNYTLIFKSTFDSAHLLDFPKDEKINDLLPSETGFLVTRLIGCLILTYTVWPENEFNVSWSIVIILICNVDGTDNYYYFRTNDQTDKGTAIERT